MRSRRTIVAVLASLGLASILLVASRPAAGEAPGAPSMRHNVLVTITIGKIEGGEKKPQRTYELVVADSGEPAKLSTANQIPIPSTTVSTNEGGHVVPVTAFNYQNVGFRANVRALPMLPDGSLPLNIDIEDTALYDSSALPKLSRGEAAAPVVASLSQTFSAVLKKGTPLTTTLVDDPKAQSVYVQLGAEVQR